MKNFLLRKATVALASTGIALALYACGDDTATGNDANSASSTTNNTTKPVYNVDEPSYVYSDGSTTYLVSATGVVKDTLGNAIGYADISTGTIVVGEQTISNVNFASCDIASPITVSSPAWVLKTDITYVIYPDGRVTDINGVDIGRFVSETSTTGTITDLNGTVVISNVDLATLKIVSPLATSSSSSETGIAYSSSVEASYSSAIEPVANSSSTPVQNSSSSIASSSSQSSSSSVAPSSSSVNTELKYVSGGASGSGWATRYWDCCKPSCSWTENAGSGNEAKQCTVSGSSITDWSAQSVCSGGTAATCTSQIPIIINDNLAYAFAAVPSSNGGKCGHCYALTFDGTGKYETKANHQAIKGKVLVVMASNVGSDVSQGQFDIMIPGGGVGIYNGCSNMPGWQSGSMGAQYGGLLTDCENSVGYDGDLLTLRKNCLVQKCNSVFSGDAVAKEGCLFLANWMQAAGNPNHTYKEVECPAELTAQYR